MRGCGSRAAARARGDAGHQAAGRDARRRPARTGLATHRGRASVLALALLVGACGGGTGATTPGPSAAVPGSGPASTARVSPSAASAAPMPSTTVPETPMASAVTLASTAFDPGGSIPSRFTCDGEDGSPDLAWAGAPGGTAAFVLVVDDPDADGFVHWIAYNLTGSESGALPLGVSASPDAPPQGTNGFGKVGWGGPCPPSGEHRYRFTLTALGMPLELATPPDKATLDDALRTATVLGSTTLEGRYRRR